MSGATKHGAASRIADILQSDGQRWRLLDVVAALQLPDCWIAAWFIRNAVWQALHDRPLGLVTGDVDGIWFDLDRPEAELDRAIEDKLQRIEPAIVWSVKNQARMHTRNGDAPYASATDAMRYWPETATAVAVQRTPDGACEIAAPFGLGDLFGLAVRPTAAFATTRRPIFDVRVNEKRWLELWPRLRLIEP